MELHLIDPERDPRWHPFVGVRPIAELRAGAWRIRERWERLLGLKAEAVHAPACANFFELDEPPCLPDDVVDGPAVVVRSDFAPAVVPFTLDDATRRLVHDGEVVGWIVGKGKRWSAIDGGDAQEVPGQLVNGTVGLLDALEQFLPDDCRILLNELGHAVPDDAIVLGDRNLIAAGEATVEPGVVFDVRDGPVTLAAGVEVRHGTRLTGPLAVGPGTRLVGGDIRTSAIGPRCVVRGEVAGSCFIGYANKAHDGFVGNSILGHWVNLGALTTTSNLKNTYGNVRLVADGTTVDTGRIFVGSLIGDHAKTAIGTMLSTGTIIGAGANLFGGSPPKWVNPFAWGSSGAERMSEEGFLRVARRVMPRRDIEFTDRHVASLHATYRRHHP